MEQPFRAAVRYRRYPKSHFLSNTAFSINSSKLLATGSVYISPYTSQMLWFSEWKNSVPTS